MRKRLDLLSALLLAPLSMLVAVSADATTLEVGPGKTYATPCAAIAGAGASSTIEIDAAGNYAGDVCGWSTNNLTLRGVNGRPHIDAAGNSSGGKAIWVIGGNDTTVDNIEFSGCHVHDKNGAGIRQEGANLTVLHSYFHDNEDGILAGDVPGSIITIQFSEFAHNGFGDGQSHNLYINHIAKLVFEYNWSHAANVGHLLKTRALENDIRYNRLTGESGGNESYEVSMPSGGVTFVIGNLVEQPASSPNSGILDYLSEPLTANPDNRLYVINNTFVNDLGHGTFMQINPAMSASIIARNNIFVGGGIVTSQLTPPPTLDHNYSGADPGFVDALNYDYRLLSTASVIDAGADPGSAPEMKLTPLFQYVHPTGFVGRPDVGPFDIGAYEWSDRIFRNDFD